LATVIGAGCVLWVGKRLFVLSSSEFTEYVLFEEERVGDRAWGDRVSHRWHGVLGYGAAATSKGWICVDDEESGIYSARVLSCMQSPAENESTAPQSRGRGGLEELQGVVLHLVCSWDVLCKWKLYQILNNTDDKKVFWGAYFAYFYLGSYGRSIIHLPHTESINLLIVLNAMGVVGRIGPGLVADWIGAHNSLIPIVAINSLCLFAWMGVNSKEGLYAWACIYGIVGAAIQSLFPTALSNLTTDLRMAGTRMGMVFTMLSFATLTGSPIAGQLIQRKGGGYEYGQIFAGTVMFVGCCFLIAARYATNKKLMVKI
jgi:hypothetical protein